MKLYIVTLITFLVNNIIISSSYTDLPCQWKSKTGSSFDLQPLTILDDNLLSYTIKDGDIPCTPEIEPSYNYIWNFCADITTKSFPTNVCNAVQMGAALQYIDRDDGYKECNVIGLYDPARDDTYFSLIDINDPSKGISMKYLYGHRCPSGQLRSATITVKCANVKAIIESGRSCIII